MWPRRRQAPLRPFPWPLLLLRQLLWPRARQIAVHSSLLLSPMTTLPAPGAQRRDCPVDFRRVACRRSVQSPDISPSPRSRNQSAPVMAALDDSALSFEGEVDAGNPAGWTARFEAPQGGKVELDSFRRCQSRRWRSIIGNQTDPDRRRGSADTRPKPRDYELSGVVQFSLMARGEGVSSACIALRAGFKGRPTDAGDHAAQGPGIEGLTEIRGTGYVLEAPTQPSSVVLLISGSYSRLWIDRVQLSRSG